MLVDSHCHLDFDVLADDIHGVLARARENGVGHCVTISTRIRRFDTVRAIAEANGNVFCSVGTHPHNAHEELDITIEEIVTLSEHPKCVAIGEAGLDYHYDSSPRDAQAKGFRNHIAASRITGLPLVVHAREADDDMISILEEETGQGAFPFVLHCFSSGAELARRGLALGGYVSFSGIVTFKNAAEIQEVARFVPADRFLIETDAPYLAPIPHRGKPNQPAFVRHTAEKIAELRGVEFETIAEQSTRNFARLFSKTGLAI
ncbi:TatD family hydrolase [Pelagibacterium luteolum]|uniref:TatD DNase family protein n=1 Tax=Pelagibacterium luteolum TaxID=440168 RepID=A0A1G7Z9N6_9HYPH|nr:TatD family hydrolase [Pelagibacterium luteolum]SDH05418.1 TatD DNase family protein [Pelagibacterium luteolum]